MIARSALLVLLGALGGGIMLRLGAPMPFMIGPILLVGAVAIFAPAGLLQDYRFPETARRPFIAVIGVLIGSQFTADALTHLGALWITLPAILGYVAITQLGNAWLLRKGGYDPVTAFYGGMPGGLIEATLIGEARGGDVRVLTVQHFIRIILTILTVPLLFWLLSGAAVGSAAGQSLGHGAGRIEDIPLILIIAGIGYVIGIRSKLPAGQLMGPLILSALLHGGNVITSDSPPWLVQAAQLVIGTALGARFAGLSRKMLLHAAGLGVLSVGWMLGFGFAIGLALAPFAGQGAEVIFIAFAPGGVTEMSLIALSLQANPVFVSLHHLVRILFAVGISARLERWTIGKPPAQ